MADYDNATATPEAPTTTQAPAPAAAPEAPSLRETLERAVQESPIEAPASDRETRSQTEGKSLSRGPDGKFAPKKAPEGATVPSEEQVQAASDPSPTVEEPEEAMPSVDNAPKSWKAAAKERWANVDPVIRAEVHRREREATKAIAENAPVRKFAESFKEAINPFAQHYAPTGIAPLQLMRNLMEADVHLSTAPMADRAKYMAHLIGAYKIDINMLDAALSGGNPNAEPIAGVEKLLNERLAPISQFVQSEQQRRQQVIQQEGQRTSGELDQMARDTKNYPHFALVSQDMADVTELALKRGIYLSPQQAYARAVAMSPEAQAANQSQAGQQRAQVAHDAATRSLGASLSVSGSPAGLKQSVAPEDLRGTIEAAWEAAQGR